MLTEETNEHTEHQNNNKENIDEENNTDTNIKTNNTSLLTSNLRSGIYIPPYKLAQIYQKLIEEKNPNNPDYQKMMWELLKKSINGIINKVNCSNIHNIVLELFNENLFRGKGLLAKAIVKSQTASVSFTNVYAALVSVINTKLPDVARIIINRYVVMFQKAYKRNSKIQLQSCLKMIAHLVNQQVVNELLAFEILVLFLDNASDDSVELACEFLKEVGQALETSNPSISQEIFEKFRLLLQEGNMDKKTQYSIEALFAVRKNNYTNFPSVIEELDLVEDDDKIIHNVSIQDEIQSGLDKLNNNINNDNNNINNTNKNSSEPDFENLGTEEQLDIFTYDPDFEKNEEQWNQIKLELLGETDENDNENNFEDQQIQELQELKEAEENDKDKNVKIIDMTETDLINLKRTIYLIIISSLDYEECCHKLLKLNLRQGQETELISMIIDCCIQEKNYLKFFGLLAERFCLLNDLYKDCFESQFENQYKKLHRLETNKLRNLANLFVHLLYTKAISWSVLSIIRLTEEDTTTSSRIFIKTLFLELAKLMGIEKLSGVVTDKNYASYLNGLFIKGENPKNTRFCINYFTSIGLGALTEDLRDYLEKYQALVEKLNDSDDSDSESEDIKALDDDVIDNSDESNDSSDSEDSDNSSIGHEENENREAIDYSNKDKFAQAFEVKPEIKIKKHTRISKNNNDKDINEVNDDESKFKNKLNNNKKNEKSSSSDSRDSIRRIINTNKTNNSILNDKQKINNINNKDDEMTKKISYEKKRDEREDRNEENRTSRYERNNKSYDRSRNDDRMKRSKDYYNNRDSRDNRNYNRDNRENRNYRDNRDNRDYKDSRDDRRNYHSRSNNYRSRSRSRSYHRR